MNRAEKGTKSGKAEGKPRKGAFQRSPAADGAAERLAVLFKALADPTRLHILDLLRRCLEEATAEGAQEPEEGLPGEVTVGEICLYVTGDRDFTSTVFHHIKELKNAGLVSVRRDGKHKRCRLNPEGLAEMATYFQAPGQRDDQDNKNNKGDAALETGEEAAVTGEIRGGNHERITV